MGRENLHSKPLRILWLPTYYSRSFLKYLCIYKRHLNEIILYWEMAGDKDAFPRYRRISNKTPVPSMFYIILPFLSVLFIDSPSLRYYRP